MSELRWVRGLMPDGKLKLQQRVLVSGGMGPDGVHRLGHYEFRDVPVVDALNCSDLTGRPPDPTQTMAKRDQVVDLKLREDAIKDDLSKTQSCGYSSCPLPVKIVDGYAMAFCEEHGKAYMKDRFPSKLPDSLQPTKNVRLDSLPWGAGFHYSGIEYTRGNELADGFMQIWEVDGGNVYNFTVETMVEPIGDEIPITTQWKCVVCDKEHGTPHQANRCCEPREPGQPMPPEVEMRKVPAEVDDPAEGPFGKPPQYEYVARTDPMAKAAEQISTEVEVGPGYKLRPWESPNDHGEKPGDICCARAAGGRCYEHRQENYDFDGRLMSPGEKQYHSATCSCPACIVKESDDTGVEDDRVPVGLLSVNTIFIVKNANAFQHFILRGPALEPGYVDAISYLAGVEKGLVQFHRLCMVQVVSPVLVPVKEPHALGHGDTCSCPPCCRDRAAATGKFGKVTSSQWRSQEMPQGNIYIWADGVHGSAEFHLATVHKTPDGRGSEIANAKLIAAAPELARRVQALEAALKEATEGSTNGYQSAAKFRMFELKLAKFREQLKLAKENVERLTKERDVQNELRCNLQSKLDEAMKLQVRVETLESAYTEQFKIRQKYQDKFDELDERYSVMLAAVEDAVGMVNTLHDNFGEQINEEMCEKIHEIIARLGGEK